MVQTHPRIRDCRLMNVATVVSGLAMACTQAAPRLSPAPCPQPSTSVTQPRVEREQQWARAEDSTEPEREWHYQWYSDHGGACLVDLGCPFEGARIPDCVGQHPLVTPGQDVVGQIIAVRGRLEIGWGGRVTQMKCPRYSPCCNTQEAGIGLRVGNQKINLEAPERPRAFRCDGDTMQGCCGFDSIGSEVIVEGRLKSIIGVPRQRSAEEPPKAIFYSLENPRLCRTTGAPQTP